MEAPLRVYVLTSLKEGMVVIAPGSATVDQLAGVCIMVALSDYTLAGLIARRAAHVRGSSKDPHDMASRALRGAPRASDRRHR
jgi:hypothetical protein